MTEPGPSGYTKEEGEDRAQRDTLEAVVDSEESADIGRQIEEHFNKLFCLDAARAG